ncbi:8826_t:CDS:1 [Entrophospora sp. SA101]|nr:8826_t:CDS:1 [Entrophospora sp. SA101]CAJ0857212.1 10747_t:CDS:1 [Entrophospora sp. SA101]
MTIYRGIYIPVNGPPEVKRINNTSEEICRLLECTNNQHITICDLDNYDLAILYDDDGYAKSLPQNPLATRLIYQRMGRDDLPPIRGPVVLVDDYRKLSLKDLRKLLKIPYNRERIENASRKMLEDVQAFLKRQQDTKDYTLDAK